MKHYLEIIVFLIWSYCWISTLIIAYRRKVFFVEAAFIFSVSMAWRIIGPLKGWLLTNDSKAE